MMAEIMSKAYTEHGREEHDRIFGVKKDKDRKEEETKHE